MKIYDKVKLLLQLFPDLRDSDRKLIWTVWEDEMGFTPGALGSMNYHCFMEATSPESIRRCRQKIQENHPELRSSKEIQGAKNSIARQKGTHIYREVASELDSYRKLANSGKVVKENKLSNPDQTTLL